MNATERAAQRWHATCTRCRHGLIYDDAHPLDATYCDCPTGRGQAALAAWADGTTP